MSGTALVPMSDIQAMAQAFAKSGLFGTKTPDQCMALLLLAQAENCHPAIAMRDFDIIQGKPAKKSEAMLRSFIAADGVIEWHEMSDTKADASFTHPKGSTGKPVRISWDLDRAKKAGLPEDAIPFGPSSDPAKPQQAIRLSLGCAATVYGVGAALPGV